MDRFFSLTNRLSLQKAALRLFTLIAIVLISSLIAQAQILADNFTDTGAPPFRIGPYFMSQAIENNIPNGTGTNVIPLNNTANLEINPQFVGGYGASLEVVTTGPLFPWREGYSGKAYGALTGRGASVRLPAGIKAFYLYAKPLVGEYEITVTAYTTVRVPLSGGAYTLERRSTEIKKTVSYLEPKYFGFRVEDPAVNIDDLRFEITNGAVYIGDFGYSTCGLNYSAFTASNQLNCANPNSSTLTYAVPAGSNQTNFIFVGPNALFEQTTQNKITVSRPGEYLVYPYNPATANGTETCPLALTLGEDKSPPNVTLGNDGPLSCSNPTITLSATGGQSGTTYAFTGPDNFSQTGTNPTAKVTKGGTYSLLVTGPNGCTQTIETRVEGQNNAPPTPTITGLNTSYCRNAGAVTLTGNPAGGSFTINGQPASQLDPASLNTGNYTIRYSITQNGCTSFTEQTVAIKAIPEASFSGLAGPYCASSAPVTLVPVNYGGDFTGQGVMNNTFTPAQAGNGGFITYTLTIDGCTNSSRQSVTVNPLPTAFTLSGGGSYCAGSTAPAVNLLGSQTGVRYQLRRNEADVTGAVVDGTGSAISFGPQTEVGTYTVLATNASSCQQAQTGSVSVTRNQNPEAGLNSNGPITCLKPQSILNASGGDNGATYRFSGPNQFVQNGTGSQATVRVGGPYSLTVTNTTGCSATTGYTVEENKTPPQQVNLSNDGGLSCIKTSSALSYGSTTPGATFVLSGPFLNGSTATGPGQYTVTATNPANGCTATTTTDVTQNIAPPTGVSLSSSGILSANTPTVTLTAASTSTANVGVSYIFGQPAQQSGVNQARVTSSGTYSVTATRADNGCSATASTSVQGASSPSACRGTSASINLTAAGSPTRYEWYVGVATGQPLRDGSVYQGTATASLRVVSVTQSQVYYAKVFYGDGSSVVYGPYRVTLNPNCGAREAAAVDSPGVEPGTELRITLLGNPLQGELLRAQVTGAAGKRLQVELLDLNGRPVRQQVFELAESAQVVDWNVNNSSSGIYLLQATTGQQRQSVKVVKP